jgi:hypothetical protein
MSGVGEDQIDAIVGAALKAMVESGVGNARVGAFSSSFRDEVASILGVKQAKPAEPDILQLVTQAVRQAMTDPSISPRAVAPKKVEAAKRVYVSVGGKPTSVTLSAESLRKLYEATGGRKEAKAIIQELAASAPADAGNRSGWIQERMLAFAGVKADGESARH